MVLPFPEHGLAQRAASAARLVSLGYTALSVLHVDLWLNTWFLDNSPFLCKTYTPDSRPGRSNPSLSWGRLEKTPGVAPCGSRASSPGLCSLSGRDNSSRRGHTPSESTYRDFLQLGLCGVWGMSPPWEVRCSRQKGTGLTDGFPGPGGHLRRRPAPIPTAQCLLPTTRGQHMALVPRRREALDNALGGQSWPPASKTCLIATLPQC